MHLGEHNRWSSRLVSVIDAVSGKPKMRTVAINYWIRFICIGSSYNNNIIRRNKGISFHVIYSQSDFALFKFLFLFRCFVAIEVKTVSLGLL